MMNNSINLQKNGMFFDAFKTCRYVIVYKKGYQESQKPYSSVTTKVKGLSFTNLTNKSMELFMYGGFHVWDSSDFVIPPEVY